MRLYTEKNPKFSDTIKITDTTDPGNANLINEAAKQLIQNDLVINERIKQCLGEDSEHGDSQGLVVTFDSNDNTSADEWTNVAAMQSGETHKSIFGKISTMFRNVRYLYKLLGTTDISKFGQGTVTDIIKELEEQKIGNIKAGTVETSAAGTSAAVSVNKTGTAATINFKIPKGDTGATGPKGATGAQGPKGDTGPAGPSKISDSAAVTVKGEYALDAVENNAAVPGTLAYELAQVNSNLVPIILLGHDVSTNEQTFQIENIADYEMLVLQSMSGNVTLGTTTIFRNRFLDYRVHYVYTHMGITIFVFETNTTVRVYSDSDNGRWVFITGIKLA